MEDLKIPKIIHYVWLGGDMPDEVKNNIKQWQNALPDYEFCLWGNEKYAELNPPLYVKQAYEAGRYAFVADYLRLYALYKIGGIYLDTDVIINKDFKELLKYDFVISYEVYARLSTAVILACAGNENIEELLKWYDRAEFINADGSYNLQVNTILFFEYFYNKYNISILNKTQLIKNMLFLKSKYLSVINVFTHKVKIKKCTFAAHLIYGSWGDKGKKMDKSIKSLPIIWKLFYALGMLKNVFFYKIKKGRKIKS